MSRKPDYGFREGLNIRVIRFEDDGSERHARIELDAEEVAELPSVGDDPMRDKEVFRQIKTNHRVRRLGGAAIGFAVVGSETAENVYLMHSGWGSYRGIPVVMNAAGAIVAADPNIQIVLMDSPGVGGSENLPPTMKRSIRQGNYERYGELAARAVHEVTDGRRVHVGGHSLGTRVAIAQTPFINDGEGVETLVLNDPPGSRVSNMFSLGARLLGHESRHGKQYIANGLDRDIFPFSIDTVTVLTAGVRSHQLFVDPFGLSKATLEPELRRAAPFVHGDIRVLLPDMSALHDWRMVSDLVGRVRRESDTEAAIEAWVVEGHTHSWLVAAKGIEAMLYSEGRISSPFSR